FEPADAPVGEVEPAGNYRRHDGGERRVLFDDGGQVRYLVHCDEAEKVMAHIAIGGAGQGRNLLDEVGARAIFQTVLRGVQLGDDVTISLDKRVDADALARQRIEGERDVVYARHLLQCGGDDLAFVLEAVAGSFAVGPVKDAAGDQVVDLLAGRH